MYDFSGYQMIPGVRTEIEQVVAATGLTWSEASQLRFLPVQIDGASRDAGNTGFVTVLRPNLLMGKITATGKFKQWDPTATDGSQIIGGVLVHELVMQFMGSNADRFSGTLLVTGGVYARALTQAALTTSGIVGTAEEFNIRAQLNRFFQLDDDLQGGQSGGSGRGITILAASATLGVAHAGQILVIRGAVGAVNLTLPATPSKGRRFGPIINVSDQNLTITAGTADTMVVLNDLNADSVSLSTASEKIGGAFDVIGDGTGWIVLPTLWETQTQTIVT
jgi:hypothetical protein